MNFTAKRSSGKEESSKDLRAAKSGEFRIGGDLPVWRLGFGTMRITGKGIWGPPKDHDEAIRVLRRAIELGVNFIDTADSYGPHISEQLIAEALYPYPQGLVIATKAGFDRTGPDQWIMNGRPEHLREACDGSLKRLKLDRIDLYQLHHIDPKVPAEDQLDVPAKTSETTTGEVNFSSDESESVRMRSEPSTRHARLTLSGQTIRVNFGSRARRASGCQRPVNERSTRGYFLGRSNSSEPAHLTTSQGDVH